MATHTVHDRDRHEEKGRPYTFDGTLEVVHTAIGGARVEHVAVYRRDDGRHVVEFRKRGLLPGDPATDTYQVVSPEDLRRAIVEGCGTAQARSVARQLGFEIGGGGRR